MDHVDRVSRRVSISTVTGFVGGTAYAALKGINPVGPTAFKVAGSFAMVATALFVPERIAYVALQNQIGDQASERRLILTSHAFGGICGGGLNGYLYLKKPMRGMFYFVPIMMTIGLIELGWEKRKEQRLQALQVMKDIGDQ